MRRVRRSLSGAAGAFAPARTSGASAVPLAIGTSGNATVTPLVLLIDFADKPHTQTAAQIASLFFASGPRDFSVKNYWEEVSYTRQGTYTQGTGRTFQVLAPAPQVVGWLRAGTDFPTSVTSYSQLLDAAQGANLAAIRQLIDNAVAWLDGTAGPGGWNFSQYRGASVNTVQAVILVRPGFGAEDTGTPSLDVYSHSAEFATPLGPTLDGTTIGDYSTVPESQFYNDTTGGVSPPLIGIGVIVHEMGHLFGLPDLYPTGAVGQTAAGYSGVGVYDLMGYGMWGSDLLIRADNPAHPSAWSKSFLGWVAPQVMDNAALPPFELRPFEYYPDVHQVYPDSRDTSQWFLIENRQRVDTGAAAPPWLFDNFLPGAGVLIWHIDGTIVDNAVLRRSNIVNNDNVYKGVDLEEANGSNLLGQPIPPSPPATSNDQAPYFGQSSDYFTQAAQSFSRDLPVPGENQTNSTPIVGALPILTGISRPPGTGDNVAIENFSSRTFQLPDGTATSIYSYFLTGPGGPPVAAWKTFNIASTLAYPLDGPATAPRAPMRSDDILSLAFDSGNNVWMGSRDQGIFRFLGTRFEFLGSSEGLPTLNPVSSFPLSPIRAMAFEGGTGSMWVATDGGLFKMRDAGAGFRVQASFTTASATPRTMPSNAVRAVAVRRGIDVKYAGTPVGLVRIVDRFTDSDTDDSVQLILRTGNGSPFGNGDVTAVAIDDHGTDDAADDIVWVGFANGVLARSLATDPVSDSDFKTYNLLRNPRINALLAYSVGETSEVWVGTASEGVEVFDLGEINGQPNKRDPYNFNADADDVAEAYLTESRGLASDNVTGIARQATTGAKPVVWLSHARDLGGSPGGVSRFDANRVDTAATAADDRVKVFRPEPGIAPEDQVNGPSSTWLIAAAADSAGNAWFASTVPGAEGVSRFGNAGVISLDSSNYVNVTAVATVTLQDDGLNASASAIDVARVRVTSSADAQGFSLLLPETGVNTGVFTGRFGFSVDATDNNATPPVIRVASGDKVTVVYFDLSPLGERKAEATWKKEIPFEDGLFVSDYRCFIATAAYGSALAPEVRVFRRFRDEVLVNAPGGRVLVDVYYRWSPPLAVAVARSRVLRSVARFALAPAALLAGVAAGTDRAERVAVFAALSCLAAVALQARRSDLRQGRGRAQRTIPRRK